MINEINKPNSQEEAVLYAELISNGLYIPHDKLVGIIKNINEIEGLKSAYKTYHRMCRFCASVEGWHEAASVIETYLVEEKRKRAITKLQRNRWSLFRFSTINYFIGDTGNVFNNV